MQILYVAALGVIVLLGYLANPKNKINRWYCIAGLLFWIGAIKEPLLLQIIPYLETHGFPGISVYYAPIHDIFTWILYTLATPTLLIAVINLSKHNKIHPKHMKIIKIAMYIPGLILSFFFHPLGFYEYPDTSYLLAFRITYTVYNIGYSIAYAYVAIKGFKTEKNIKSRRQKQRVALIFLPLLYFWLFSIFVTHLVDVLFPGILSSGAFSIWIWNVIIMAFIVIAFVVMAFRDGFMGLKLVSQRYNWNERMDLINISAYYTNHMFKQQVATMELCIKQLNEHYVSAGNGKEVVERLNILSRSINTLKNFVDRINRHSQIIHLTEEPCRVTDLLAEAAGPIKESGIQVNIDIPDSLFLLGDKIHLTEVFTNLFVNASEAIQENGKIEITGVQEKAAYRLMFKDNGMGIDEGILNDIFIPHFSTKKSKEKNFGLGLYYCKNVITAHGGRILAESIEGKETTIIITFPAKRICKKPLTTDH